MKADRNVYWPEAWEGFSKKDLSPQKGYIIVDQPKSMFQKLFGCFSPGLEEKMKKDREIIYCLAKLDYDPDDSLHFGTIRALFTSLTNEELCPAIGLHWKRIGFQSDDPSRDFRATGMLGPLQISSFIFRHKEWAQEVHELSLNEVQNFPLAVSQFGMTRICLEIFRSGKLNGYCNCQTSYVTCFDDLYCALTLLFYQNYVSENGTAAKYGIISQEVETKAKNKPVELLKKYQTIKNYESIKTLIDPLI